MMRKTLNNNQRTAELPDTHLYETTILSLATFQEKRKGQTTPAVAAGLKRRLSKTSPAFGPDSGTCCEAASESSSYSPHPQSSESFVNLKLQDGALLSPHPQGEHPKAPSHWREPPPHVEKVKYF